jgi:hypothetical protein
MYLKNKNTYTKVVTSAKKSNRTQIEAIISTKKSVIKCKKEQQHTKNGSNKHEKEHQ